MIRLGIWLALFSTGIATLFAQQSVPYEFAIPEFTQTLTLGIYNDSGKLVRRLVQQAKISDFEIGVNGLIGKWDGKDDAGQFVPRGTYQMRGYAVGNLETEGVGYHFNDWVAELGEAAPITKVLALTASPHGGVYVLAEISDGQRLLFYYKSGEGLLWSRYLTTPFEGFQAARQLGLLQNVSLGLHSFIEPFLAADDASVAVVQAGELSIFRSLTGGEVEVRKMAADPQAVTFRNGQLILAEGSRLLVDSAGPERQFKSSGSSVRIKSLAGAAAGLLSADLNGMVWKIEKDKWSELKLEGEPKVLDLAWGGDNAFWAVAEKAKVGRLVGEFSVSGEFLKNLQMPDGNLVPTAVSAAPPSGEIYVLRQSETSSSQQEILGIRLAENSNRAAEAPPVWEIFCDKKIQDSTNFGLVDGQPIAEVSQIPDGHFTLKMVDPMTKRPKQVRLEFVNDAAGVQLRSADGLVLDSVVTGADIRRVAIKPGKNGTIQLYVGRKGFVEEFNLSGLNQIALLDVGEIEWTGK